MAFSLAEFPGLVGRELFRSEWVRLDAADEEAFGHATFLREDFLGRAPSGAGPDGERTASGFLLLSMLVAFHKRELDLSGASGLNYGLDRVRFLRPVRTGRRVRARATLTGIEGRGPGRTRVATRNVLEAEGDGAPAMIADWITLFVDQDAGTGDRSQSGNPG
ncbi:MaoC/PaaZ C-terminal domain-containing protein [Actinomadura sp. WMMB 499]|uniref:MaoC/PaaZ C-terminal domain-containing protein n=1 Tax=Actinomadura sp. WMMB 499 TaxID=1219491 RepID=UPI0012483A79|nr:MaoC/PaaZ C-terminal domain-containing protein [Actinomadura sp. WMMB 499]QFG24907.1 MaoC family dehydratase [Actinomadura sp. WMMB 499]